MKNNPTIYVGDNVIDEFIKYCINYDISRFFLISDKNTYRILGDKIEKTIHEKNWDLISIVLDPNSLHTDDISISRVLSHYDATPRTFISVGSGTITDITRFTSHRSQNSFISFPTAASVDAYTSKISPTTIGGLKRSIKCSVAKAIFTDLCVITESPKFLTASGFGDLASKFTSSSDWMYSKIIWGMDFDLDIYKRALGAALNGAKVAEGILNNDPASFKTMMEAQFASGLCMADFDNSAPASGGEHHIAHLWEMMFHWAGREGLYHGNAVGVATIIEAEWYERLRELSIKDAEKLLSQVKIPSRLEQERTIRTELPEIAEELIESNPIFMQLSDPWVLERVKKNILDNWDEIQVIAANVPPASQFRTWLKSLGGPTTTAELDLSQKQAQTAIDHGHYLRERFSINNIRKLFGW